MIQRVRGRRKAKAGVYDWERAPWQTVEATVAGMLLVARHGYCREAQPKDVGERKFAIPACRI